MYIYISIYTHIHAMYIHILAAMASLDWISMSPAELAKIGV